MIRLHQFSKVELVSITTPEQSAEEHERMTDAAQEYEAALSLIIASIVLDRRHGIRGEEKPMTSKSGCPAECVPGDLVLLKLRRFQARR